MHNKVILNAVLVAKSLGQKMELQRKWNLKVQNLRVWNLLSEIVLVCQVSWPWSVDNKQDILSWELSMVLGGREASSTDVSE